jgi:hypothetical protein
MVNNDLNSISIADQKFAFIHIPKTAGMTLSAILEKKFPDSKTCPVRLYPDLVKMSESDIAKYQLFRGHFPYEVLASLIKVPFIGITVLREPVGRFYSYYKFMKKREDFEKFPVLAKEIPGVRKMDFAEFCRSDELHVVKDGLNQQTRYLCRKIPEMIALPYAAEKKQPTSEEVERAKARLESLECFGVAERFQEFLFLLSYTFGWEPLLDNLVLNTSGKPDNSEINDETRALVREKNKPDVELYQYAVTLFDGRYERMLSALVAKYGNVSGTQTTENLQKDEIVKLLSAHASTRSGKRNNVLDRFFGLFGRS